MLLELEYEHCFGVFLALFEVLVKCRDRLAVLEAVVFEILIRMLLDLLAFYLSVVEYKQHAVGCHVHVELAAPESCFLSTLERSYRVLGISGLFAVPESSVSDNACAAEFVLLCKCFCLWNHHYECGN